MRSCTYIWAGVGSPSLAVQGRQLPPIRRATRSVGCLQEYHCCTMQTPLQKLRGETLAPLEQIAAGSPGRLAGRSEVTRDLRGARVS